MCVRVCLPHCQRLRHPILPAVYFDAHVTFKKPKFPEYTRVCIMVKFWWRGLFSQYDVRYTRRKTEMIANLGIPGFLQSGKHID